MFRNFLFTMSLSGTVVFLAYMILYPLARRYFPVRWRYYTLCMCIIFYLFPPPLLKNNTLSRLFRSQPVFQAIMPPPKVNMDNTFLIVSYSDKLQIAPSLLYMWGIISFCGIISLILIIKTFYHYRRMKKTYVNIAVEQPPKKWQELFLKIKAQMKINQKVRLLCSACCTSPVTWGALSPVILFPIPSDETDEETFRLMLTHELTHIKYHHLHIKYLGLLVRTIHWFNPMVYLWFRELCNICEMMCDETVTKNMEPEQCRQYSHMILSCALQNAFCQSYPFSAHLADDAIILKRRICEMQNKKRKLWIPALFLSLTLAVSGTITSFAYTPPDTVSISDEPYESGEIIKITAAEDRTDDTADLPYDYYYTDSDGNIYPLSETAVASSSCSHQYTVPVKVTKHDPDGKGGCTVTQREALKCSKCDSIKIGDEIYTLHYNKCPH